MIKSDKFNATIQNYGCNGEGVTKVNGETVFVPYSLVGENVDGIVIKANSKYAIGKIEQINIKSHCRINAPCPYFAKCGGCQLQHTTYENSLKIKTEIVKNAIKNIGKIDCDIPTVLPSKEQYHYRNKIDMPINPKTKKLGMFRTASHNIIDIEECLLQKTLTAKLITVFNKYLSQTKTPIYDDVTKKGVLKHLVARELDNKILITVVINSNDLPDKKVLVEFLSQNFDNFGLSLNINKLKNNVILTNRFVQVYGLTKIDVCENEISYSITNGSFLQINDQIKDTMYQKIFEQIENETVVDAYSGAGLLSAMIAKHAKQVYGIEIVEEATKIADRLKADNMIQNLTNINGDCAEKLPALLEGLTAEEKSNLIVVIDPPRKGCDKKVLEAILNVRPKKIIYMSCDPSTLARDLNILLNDTNYKIAYLQPFDMFPQTKHVETLAVLEC